jgi:hypothetical protein
MVKREVALSSFRSHSGGCMNNWLDFVSAALMPLPYVLARIYQSSPWKVQTIVVAAVFAVIALLLIERRVGK